jgi:hypothetical protein
VHGTFLAFLIVHYYVDELYRPPTEMSRRICDKQEDTAENSNAEDAVRVYRDQDRLPWVWVHIFEFAILGYYKESAYYLLILVFCVKVAIVRAGASHRILLLLVRTGQHRRDWSHLFRVSCSYPRLVVTSNSGKTEAGL